MTYTSNALNQYAMTRGFVESFAYDLDGNMSKSGLAAGDYDDDGDIDGADFGVFQGCFNGPNNPPYHSGCEESDIDGDGDVDLADYSILQGCYNGPNRPPACNAGVRPTQYAYDGENRVTEVRPILPRVTDKKVTFVYDYMGRRVQKQRFGRNANNTAWLTTAESDQRFVYDQWNVVMTVNNSGTPQKKFTWGLDLSGLSGAATPLDFPPHAGGLRGVHGAGGTLDTRSLRQGQVGGLLAVEETATSGSPAYWFFYDGNGNIGQVLSAADRSIAARYEYDPYGNVIGPDVDGDGQWTDDATAYTLANPFRFSTKWLDTETDLYYYGYRYYGPRWGRWTSRDPIGEEGGLNLYAFVGNGAINRIDPHGRVSPCYDPIDPRKPMWPCGPIPAKPPAPALSDRCRCPFTPNLLDCANRVAESVFDLAKAQRKAHCDKWMHCVTTCRIGNECVFGWALALPGGLLKEIGDIKDRCRKDSGVWMDSFGDMLSNSVGWAFSFGCAIGGNTRACCENECSKQGLCD